MAAISRSSRGPEPRDKQRDTETMKLARIARDGAITLAVIEGDSARPIAGDMLSVIRAGKAGLGELAMAAKNAATVPLASVRLLAPLPNPPKGVIGIGLNYAPHVEESARTMQTQKELPTHPVIFIKPPTTIIGPGDAIVHDQAQTQQLDYESELGCVIGTGGKRIDPAKAMDHVFGYTLINDVSARDLRHGGQWTFAKGQDTFCPMGPWIVTADEIPDPHTLAIGAEVDGEVRQASNTRYMLFKIPALIAHLSSGIRLEPGDIIATGTPEGVGISFTPPKFMKPGSVVTIQVEKIGSMTNHVVVA
jgi:2-keto-4-pentenoate hydratase/2-oxohepta-3-ene-1,7-dioic acid hydratase in catechol pathway